MVAQLHGELDWAEIVGTRVGVGHLHRDSLQGGVLDLRHEDVVLGEQELVTLAQHLVLGHEEVVAVEEVGLGAPALDLLGALGVGLVGEQNALLGHVLQVRGTLDAPIGWLDNYNNVLNIFLN